MGAVTRNFANSITSTKTLDTGKNFKNLLINGDMQIYQEAVDKTNVSTDTYRAGADRYMFRGNSVSAARFQFSNEPIYTPWENGFKNALYIQTTTAETTVATSYIARVGQRIEGRMLQELAWGSGGAKPVTFSFWVRSSLTGTFACELWQRDVANGYASHNFTINSANTWEKKSVTFSANGDMPITHDTGNSLEVNIWLGAGTQFTTGTISNGAWTTTEADRAVGTTNNFINTLNANMYLTGWQLEIGDKATDFEFIPLDVNETRCMRYFEILRGSDSYDTLLATWNRNTSDMGACLDYKVKKRAEPTVSFSNANTFRMNAATGDITAASISYSNPTVYTAQININASGTPLTAGQAGYINMENGNGDAIIKMDAEL